MLLNITHFPTFKNIYMLQSNQLTSLVQRGDCRHLSCMPRNLANLYEEQPWFLEDQKEKQQSIRKALNTRKRTLSFSELGIDPEKMTWFSTSMEDFYDAMHHIGQSEVENKKISCYKTEGACSFVVNEQALSEHGVTFTISADEEFTVQTYKELGIPQPFPRFGIPLCD